MLSLASVLEVPAAVTGFEKPKRSILLSVPQVHPGTCAVCGGEILSRRVYQPSHTALRFKASSKSQLIQGLLRRDRSGQELGYPARTGPGLCKAQDSSVVLIQTCLVSAIS